ncbi:transposase, partial [Aeromonas caviae]
MAHPLGSDTSSQVQGYAPVKKVGVPDFLGMKAHIGVDAKSGLTHSLVTTAANEHDLNQLG